MHPDAGVHINFLVIQSEMSENLPFPLRPAQGERGGDGMRSRVSVRAEPVEARTQSGAHRAESGYAPRRDARVATDAIPMHNYEPSMRTYFCVRRV